MEKNIIVPEKQMQRIIALLSQANDPTSYYHFLVNGAIELTKAKYGSFFIYHNGEMKRIYASSPLLHTIKVREKGHTYNVFEAKTGHLLKSDDIEILHPRFRNLHAGSDIALPILTNKQVLGVLSVLSPANRLYGSQHYRLTLFYASIAAVIYESIILRNNLFTERKFWRSQVSHRLRNPLTPIVLYSQLLQKNTRFYSPKDKKRLDSLISSVDKLINNIDSLLKKSES